MNRAERIGELLVARGWRMAVAESTAGGLISAAILAVPGASRYFERGIVAYSKAAKLDNLGMPAELYTERGSTHQAAVRAMAEGARRISGAQVGVAESGVAGPNPGRTGLPIGTVWAAVVTPERAVERELHLPGDRTQIMSGIVDAVLGMLEEALTPGR
ncbi:MAG TPA: CinA family protein [Alphaproteobacteria bacterium]|nr:CinA family protein [Alphaproteobacteria bacterium]